MPFLKIQNKKSARFVLYATSLAIVLGLSWAGFVRKAEPDLEQVIASAQLMAQAGAIDEAEKATNDALRRDPTNLHALLVRGFIDERRHNYAGAIAAYEKALGRTTVAELTRDIEFSIVDLLRRDGRADEATKRLDAVEKGSGPTGPSLRLRGAIALSIGDAESALKMFKESAAASDRPADIDSLLVESMMRLGKSADALRVVEDAGKRGIDTRNLWYRLAGLTAASGDHERAAQYLAAYARLDARSKKTLSKDPFWKKLAQRDEYKVFFE